MGTALFWGVVLRTGEIAIEASITLLIGFLVAAVMRRMFGAEGTRKLFGGDGFKGLFRAWLIGSLLPVCSLGVIPVVREMRRAGVPSATILSFLLAAPQLNPLSFLYGLTLSEPIVIICFVIATMIIAIACGELWKRVFETNADTLPPGDEPMPAPGLKRIMAVFITAARESVGPSMRYVLIGIAFTGLLAGSLPFGSLSNTMRHDDPTSPALMALIGVPAYSGVLPGMMRIGLMFEHGNSVGAAFVLFELGVGLNVGLIIWVALGYGWRRSMMWLAGGVVGMTLAAGYAMEYPLYFPHEESSHTHAFDEWASPFTSGMEGDPETVWKKLGEKIDILAPVSLGSLVLLWLVGFSLRAFDRGEQVERWFTTAPPADTVKSMWNMHVPAPVLGLVVLGGLVAFSIAALYIYYPDPNQAFTEITQVKTEALTDVRTGKKEGAIRHIAHWDLLTRKVQVGVFIRTGRMDEVGGDLTEDLRERLEEMRDALLADQPDAARKMIPIVEAAHRKCRDHFLPPAN